MQHGTITTKGAHLVLFTIVMIWGSRAVSAQVVYDWKTKTLESSPKINRTQTVRFKIENINDILFKYSMEVSQTPISSDGEWSIIKEFMGIGGAAAKATTSDSPCTTDVTNAMSS